MVWPRVEIDGALRKNEGVEGGGEGAGRRLGAEAMKQVWQM